MLCSSRRRHTRYQGDWSSDVCPSDLEWEKKEFLDREREMLGFFVSEDPLEGYGEIFRSESTHSVIELTDLEEDEEVNYKF